MSVPRFGSISGQNVIAGPQVSGDGVMNVNFYGGESFEMLSMIESSPFGWDL